MGVRASSVRLSFLVVKVFLMFAILLAHLGGPTTTSFGQGLGSPINEEKYVFDGSEVDGNYKIFVLEHRLDNVTEPEPINDMKRAEEDMGAGEEEDTTNWKNVDPDELIQVSTLPESDDVPLVFVGQWMYLRCIASKSIFSRGFQWKFELANGTEAAATAEGTGSPVSESEDEVAEEMKLKISRSDISRIICGAHVSGKEEWIQNYLPIIVKEPVHPTITEPKNVTLVYPVGVPNNSILCEAKGYPSPDIMWFKNGEEYIDGLLFDRSTPNLSRAFVYLPTLSFEDNKALFTCNASNLKGTALKYFTIQTRMKEDSLVIILTILGIVGILIIGLLTVSLWLHISNTRRLRFGTFTEEDVEEFFRGNAEMMKECGRDTVTKALYHPYDRLYEINPDNLSIDYKSPPLGCGEFGVVLPGRLQTHRGSQQVAVKTTKGSDATDASQLKQLLTEIKFMVHVGKHDNIIEFLGAVTKDLINRNVYVVVAHCQYGSLLSYLRKHREMFLDEFFKDRYSFSSSSSSTCSSSSFSSSPTSCNKIYVQLESLIKTSDLIVWAYQIANALAYLASKQIIHGDVALRNMLLDGSMTVKLTDFGLSRHIHKKIDENQSHSKKKNVTMPWPWMAPETLRDNIFSSDVWSYGVCLYELFSLGEIPYLGMRYNDEFLMFIENGTRLIKPEFANSEIYSAMLDCWKLEPNERPTFIALKGFFMDFIQTQLKKRICTSLASESESH